MKITVDRPSSDPYPHYRRTTLLEEWKANYLLVEFKDNADFVFAFNWLVERCVEDGRLNRVPKFDSPCTYQSDRACQNASGRDFKVSGITF
jgi:hypothetical protein